MEYIENQLVKFLLVFSLALPSVVFGSDSADIVIGTPGNNVTLWKGFNVSGKVFIKLNDGSKNSCAKLWWIRLGLNYN